MRIVCLGDSLTAGLIPDSPSHWLNILKRNAVNSYINKGICGDTTGGMLSRFYQDVVKEQAKSVIIMGGGNDFIMGADLGTVQSNIMALVHQAYFYHIIPVLGIPISFNQHSIRKDWSNFTDFGVVAEKYQAYRTWLYQFGLTFHTEILDFEQAFTRWAGENRAEYFSDGIHPNEKGNKIMAALILQKDM